MEKRWVMGTYAYVDNSNRYIEGCRVSAVKKGLAKNVHVAQQRFITDHTWQMGYGALYDFLCVGHAVVRLWGSQPPGDSFWSMLERKGFHPTVMKRISLEKKKVDVAIAHRMTKDAYTLVKRQVDHLLLVAGDSDYLPVVRDLIFDGYDVEVAFWDHATRELREAASKFISLNAYHSQLTRHAHEAAGR
jgi:uncharacterized LabA/DUF88 family protein